VSLYTYAAKLVRVVDADTVRLELDLGFRLHRHEDSYRLLRINAPEINTPEGKKAAAALDGFLVGKTLIATTQKADNFGRYLVEVLADGKNVADWLVESGWAAYRSYP
jgi:micrococcal nuclease